MGIVTLNKGEGTVTMNYEAYRSVYRDSIMLFLLLNGMATLEDIKGRPGLGYGYTMCHNPMSSVAGLKYVSEEAENA